MKTQRSHNSYFVITKSQNAFFKSEVLEKLKKKKERELKKITHKKKKKKK